jgi:hypothetical protein
VTSGLRPGDRLIVEGLLNLKPGTAVQPAAPQQVARAEHNGDEPNLYATVQAAAVEQVAHGPQPKAPAGATRN